MQFVKQTVATSGIKKLESIENVKFLKREKKDPTEHGSGITTSILQMYNSDQTPSGKLDYDEFAGLALERFSVLQLFENVGTKYMKGGNDYIKKLDEEFRKSSFLKTILNPSKDTPIDENEVDKDIISHFILRLAFCQTEELKRWFITQEVDMFRYKLNRISLNEPNVIERFLKENDLFYTPISESEKSSIKDSLTEMGLSAVQQSQKFYKISFLEVLELVKSRKVFIKNGYAYVTIHEFNSVLSNVYRTRLSKSLTTLSRHIKDIEEDQRISDLLKILRERDVGESYADTKSRDHLTAENLDQISLKSYPMCMKHLHEALKSNHHLRHYGRLQLVLFLKGIGLPLEENLKFWRTEFSKGTIPVDRFDKEYAYNIRHSYGKEGKRTSYTPYSCLKIITSHMPGNNDYHGCPFKHFERDFLKQKIKQYGRLSEDETQQVMEQSDSNNYQIACQRYFEFSHKTEELVSINHPNNYFEQSQRLLNTTNKLTNNRQQPYIKSEHIKIEMTQ